MGRVDRASGGGRRETTGWQRIQGGIQVVEKGDTTPEIASALALRKRLSSIPYTTPRHLKLT